MSTKDISSLLWRCIGQKADIACRINENETKIMLSDEVIDYELLHEYCNEPSFTIIPYVRKLKSLTNDESRELARLSGMENFDLYSTYKYITTTVLVKEFKKLQPAICCLAMGYSHEYSSKLILLDKFNVEQINYLTDIGIAWWATQDMWESGLIKEIKLNL